MCVCEFVYIYIYICIPIPSRVCIYIYIFLFESMETQQFNYEGCSESNVSYLFPLKLQLIDGA